jgi:hypothetical protein
MRASRARQNCRGQAEGDPFSHSTETTGPLRSYCLFREYSHHLAEHSFRARASNPYPSRPNGPKRACDRRRQKSVERHHRRDTKTQKGLQCGRWDWRPASIVRLPMDARITLELRGASGSIPAWVHAGACVQTTEKTRGPTDGIEGNYTTYFDRLSDE